jgi:hypothetical protein
MNTTIEKIEYERKKMKTKITLIMLFSILFLSEIYAGDLDSPDYPNNTSSYTLEDIYNRLKYGTTGSTSTFAEPTAAPGATGHTVNEIYNAADEALSKTQIPKTGQTTSYYSGDDGDLEKGLAWPSPRFTDNLDGTITDNLTGLVWWNPPDATYYGNWSEAFSLCNSLENGVAGLSDGSSAGDWRLPNINELLSLLDYSQNAPALPSGHPFTYVQSSYYWTSTTYADHAGVAYVVCYDNGVVDLESTGTLYYVFAVRDGD